MYAPLPSSSNRCCETILDVGAFFPRNLKIELTKRALRCYETRSNVFASIQLRRENANSIIACVGTRAYLTRTSDAKWNTVISCTEITLIRRDLAVLPEHYERVASVTAETDESLWRDCSSHPLFILVLKATGISEPITLLMATTNPRMPYTVRTYACPTKVPWTDVYVLTVAEYTSLLGNTSASAYSSPPVRKRHNCVVCDQCVLCNKLPVPRFCKLHRVCRHVVKETTSLSDVDAAQLKPTTTEQNPKLRRKTQETKKKYFIYLITLFYKRVTNKTHATRTVAAANEGTA